MTAFSSLKGKTLKNVTRIGNSQIIFETKSGERYIMHHIQDCCETVEIDDVCGDLKDLIGQKITLAEESCSRENPRGKEDAEFMAFESETWTFYKISTAKNSVTITWRGSSNGYYSESVDFHLIEEQI